MARVMPHDCYVGAETRNTRAIVCDCIVIHRHHIAVSCASRDFDIIDVETSTGRVAISDAEPNRERSAEVVEASTESV